MTTEEPRGRLTWNKLFWFDSDLYHHILQFSLASAQFLALMSVVVSPPEVSTGTVITEVSLRFFVLFFFSDGKTATVYHYGSLPVLSNHCSQVGCEPLLCRRGTASACCAAPGCSGIFIIFKEAAPSWVVLAMCRPGLCVNMCVSECVCVREFVPCCLHVLWINSVRVVLQACVFA